MTQGVFAAAVGTDAQKQSLYETEKRELRGAYLTAIAAAGVDVAFILTGQRQVGSVLPPDEAELLERFRAMPPASKRALQYVAASFVGAHDAGHAFALVVPEEAELTKIFRTMLGPLDLGDALEGTARKMARQLPILIEAELVTSSD